MKHYTVVEDYQAAERLKAELIAQGVSEEDISIVLKTTENEQPADFSPETLGDQKVTVDQAPSGTISVFGISFSILTAVAGGALIAGVGPIAATAGSLAVLAGGTGLLLSGLGVPEEEHDHFEQLLHEGGVLVAVESHEHSGITELMQRAQKKAA